MAMDRSAEQAMVIHAGLLDPPPSYFAAFAVSASGLTWAFKRTTRDAAEGSALGGNRGPYATTLGWGKNTYIAAARSRDGRWGFGWGGSPSIAKRGALSDCPAGARVMVVLHTHDGVVELPPITYGAIAFSNSTGRYVIETGASSEAKAQKRALKKLGAADAKILVARDTYLALAHSRDGGFCGSAYDNAVTAREQALKNNRGANPQILEVRYTDGELVESATARATTRAASHHWWQGRQGPDRGVA